MRKPTRKSLINKMDKLMSQIVIKRDKKCVMCGSTKQLGAGHVFSRRNFSTRWNINNVFAQCWADNYRHVRDQYPYFKWYTDKFGAKKLEELRQEHSQITHYKLHDLENIYEGLKIYYENL